MVKIRTIYLIASLVLVPVGAGASPMGSCQPVTPQCASSNQNGSGRIVLSDADSDIPVISDFCDNDKAAQCNADCTSQFSLCDTGHNDELPCSDQYSTCQQNCRVLSGCD